MENIKFYISRFLTSSSQDSLKRGAMAEKMVQRSDLQSLLLGFTWKSAKFPTPNGYIERRNKNIWLEKNYRFLYKEKWRIGLIHTLRVVTQSKGLLKKYGGSLKAAIKKTFPNSWDTIPLIVSEPSAPQHEMGGMLQQIFSGSTAFSNYRGSYRLWMLLC